MGVFEGAAAVAERRRGGEESGAGDFPGGLIPAKALASPWSDRWPAILSGIAEWLATFSPGFEWPTTYPPWLPAFSATASAAPPRRFPPLLPPRLPHLCATAFPRRSPPRPPRLLPFSPTAHAAVMASAAAELQPRDVSSPAQRHMRALPYGSPAYARDRPVTRQAV